MGRSEGHACTPSTQTEVFMNAKPQRGTHAYWWWNQTYLEWPEYQSLKLLPQSNTFFGEYITKSLYEVSWGGPLHFKKKPSVLLFTLKFGNSGIKIDKRAPKCCFVHDCWRMHVYLQPCTHMCVCHLKLSSFIKDKRAPKCQRLMDMASSSFFPPLWSFSEIN